MMNRGLYRVLPAHPIGLDQGFAKLRHTHGARLTLKDRDDPDKVVLYPLFKKPGVGLIFL